MNPFTVFDREIPYSFPKSDLNKPSLDYPIPKPPGFLYWRRTTFIPMPNNLLAWLDNLVILPLTLVASLIWKDTCCKLQHFISVVFLIISVIGIYIIPTKQTAEI